MELEPYEYRDPGLVIAEVAAKHRIVARDVFLVLVRDPSGAQEIRHVSRLEPEQWQGIDQHDLSQLLAAEAHRMRIPPRLDDRPWYSIMTIVARRGFTVIGRDEANWLVAWLYSNHLTGAFAGELILLTEHGWTDVTTGWGDVEPRLAVAA